jgi:UDP-glucose 4-epimerase
LIKALLALDKDITIVALTRDPNSEKAKSLSLLSNVKLQKGDLDDLQAIEAVFAAQKFDGVFSVQDHFVQAGRQALQRENVVLI